MKPDLEVVQLGCAESFKAWEHGYPFRTVRWHFHPECELHHVVATTGRYFVGDFIGDFVPGNLVLTGPNLPHNWVSKLPEGTTVSLRCRILQFDAQFIRDAARVLPDLSSFLPLLEMSRRGVLFAVHTAAVVGPMLKELIGATELRRLELFVSIIGALTRAQGSLPMTSSDYHPDPSGFMATGINESLDYIRHHLTESFGENELAAISHLSASAFSRSFRRHTGMALSSYVNRLRINLATQLLMSEESRSITDICFSCGFKNLSNFNRQFLRHKGMPPSRFRALLAENTGIAEAA